MSSLRCSYRHLFVLNEMAKSHSRKKGTQIEISLRIYNTNPRPVNITRYIHGQFLQGDMVPIGTSIHRVLKKKTMTRDAIARMILMEKTKGN